MLTFFIFLYCIVFSINDGFGSKILLMIEIWSEMQKSGFGVSCKISSPILVIIRSNVWPCVWVASWTCCSRPRDSKRSRNFKASSFEGLSTCQISKKFNVTRKRIIYSFLISLFFFNSLWNYITLYLILHVLTSISSARVKCVGSFSNN